MNARLLICVGVIVVIRAGTMFYHCRSRKWVTSYTGILQVASRPMLFSIGHAIAGHLGISQASLSPEFENRHGYFGFEMKHFLHVNRVGRFSSFCRHIIPARYGTIAQAVLIYAQMLGMHSRRTSGFSAQDFAQSLRLCTFFLIAIILMMPPRHLFISHFRERRDISADHAPRLPLQMR